MVTQQVFFSTQDYWIGKNCLVHNIPDIFQKLILCDVSFHNISVTDTFKLCHISLNTASLTLVCVKLFIKKMVKMLTEQRKCSQTTNHFVQIEMLQKKPDSSLILICVCVCVCISVYICVCVYVYVCVYVCVCVCVTVPLPLYVYLK